MKELRVRAPLKYPDFPEWVFDNFNLRRCSWYKGIQVIIDAYPLCFHPSRYDGREEINVLALLCAPDRCPLSQEDRQKLARGEQVPEHREGVQ